MLWVPSQQLVHSIAGCQQACPPEKHVQQRLLPPHSMLLLLHLLADRPHLGWADASHHKDDHHWVIMGLARACRAVGVCQT